MSDSVQIQQLKIRYRASFAEKSDQLDDHLKLLSGQSPPDHQDLTDTRAFLHKLAGSAGMYGYQDIAALARDAMQDIQRDSISILLEKLTLLRNLLKQ